MKGKSRVELEQAFDCKDEKALNDFPIIVEKCNKTHRCLDANFTLPEVIGPKSIVMTIILFQRSFL